VVEMNGDLVWSFNPDSYQIQWVNHICHDRLGLQPGQDCRQFLRSDFSFIESVVQTVTKAHRWEGVLSFKEPRIEGFLPLFSKVIQIEGQQQSLMLCTSIDLQRKQQLESSLIQQAKMAAIGKMTSDVTHEITNPLSIIMGRIEEIQQKSKQGLLTPELLDQDLTKILRTCHRINRITKSLRNFSRDSELDPKTTVFLSQIIDESLELCLDRLNQKSIHLTRTIEPNLFVTVRPSEIEQVLVNIIMNAIDAQKNTLKGRIEIQALRIGDWIQIKIQDNGCGVPSEIVADIMKPFFTTKEPGLGTGLGLSISQTLILKHGGRLFLDQDCQETCFVIELPVVETSHKGEPP